MAGKKKGKQTAGQGGGGKGGSKAKRSTRSTSGKQGNAAAATEGDPGVYGVVPSEYNIQAQIEWLTAPPVSGEKKNASNSAPPPSKKPQRGFHHDVCDGCGEGDCLMYCDKCPAAYHCICDDPPLPPEDYETIGINWKCKKCRNKVKIKTEIFDDNPETQTASASDRPIKKIFDQLIPLVDHQNPVQFKLPKEYPAFEYPFPGTSRHMLKKTRQRTKVIEVENGIIPKPTVVCFHCQISCRVGPLIQCDKCNEFFHLDCLDPPLTTIPTTVWICPLHAEPVLESKLLTSVALSERLKIWEAGDKKLDRTSVVLDFLKKAKKENPMFRRKQPIPMVSNYPKVPEMVEHCYKDTLDLIQERFGGLNTLAYVCELEKLNMQVKAQMEEFKKRANSESARQSLNEIKSKIESLRSRSLSKIEHVKNVFEMRQKIYGSEDKIFGSDSLLKTSEVIDELCDIVKEVKFDGHKKDKAVNEAAINEIKQEDSQPKPDAAESEKVETGETNGIKQDNVGQVDSGEKMPQWVLNELKQAETDIREDIKILSQLTSDIQKLEKMLKGRETRKAKRRVKPTVPQSNSNAVDSNKSASSGGEKPSTASSEESKDSGQGSSQKTLSSVRVSSRESLVSAQVSSRESLGSVRVSSQESKGPDRVSSSQESLDFVRVSSQESLGAVNHSVSSQGPEVAAFNSSGQTEEVPKPNNVPVTPVSTQPAPMIPESAIRKLKSKSSPLPMDLVKNLPRKVVNKLAACHLRDVMKKKALKESLKSAPKPPLYFSECANGNALTLRGELNLLIENTGVKVQINKDRFTIGSGDECDFKLTDFVGCQRIDKLHARVFYNVIESAYEILNYSSNGISINGMWYGCGISKNTTKASVTSLERLQEIEKMAAKRVDDFLVKNPEKMRTSDVICYCKPYPENSRKVYEGSAKLYPGVKIQIGCAKILIEDVSRAVKSSNGNLP